MKENILTIKFLTMLELPLDEIVNKEIVLNAYNRVKNLYDPEKTLMDCYKNSRMYDEMAVARNFLINNMDLVNDLILHEFVMPNRRYTKRISNLSLQNKDIYQELKRPYRRLDYKKGDYEKILGKIRSFSDYYNQGGANDPLVNKRYNELIEDLKRIPTLETRKTLNIISVVFSVFILALLIIYIVLLHFN